MTRQQLDLFLKDRTRIRLRSLSPYTAPVQGDDIFAVYTFDKLRDYLDNSSCLHILTHNSAEAVPDHSCPFFEIVYAYAGHLTYHLGEEVLNLVKGDIIIIAPAVPHAIDPCGADDLAVTIIMHPEYITSDIMSLLSGNSLLSSFLLLQTRKNRNERFLTVRSHENADVQDIMLQLLCEFFDPDRYSAANVKCQIVLMLNAFLRTLHKNGTVASGRGENRSQSMVEIINYLETNYATASLDDAARRFGYNASYLSRLIKKRLGQSFTEIKQRLVLEEARRLLDTTSMPVTEVASSVGLNNTSHFYAVFHKYFGVTPAEYRRRIENTQ